MTNQDQPPCRFNAAPATERLLSPNDRGISPFAGCLLVSIIALFLIGCGTIADLLPPGPVASTPPNSIIVFGKIELKINAWFSGSAESAQSGRLNIIPSKSAGSWGYGFGGFPKTSPLEIRITAGDDFYAVIPKEDYLFLELNFSGLTRHLIVCRNLGFRVPQDASAVYVGTVIFDERSGFLSRVFAFPRSVTFSVEDDYDQAVRRWRDRNPGFQGRTVKSLFRHEPFLNPQDLKCEVEESGFLLLSLDMTLPHNKLFVPAPRDGAAFPDSSVAARHNNTLGCNSVFDNPFTSGFC